MRRLLALLLALVGALYGAVPPAVHAQAAPCMTCLGTLTHDTILYTPLGRYSRHGSSVPRRHGKPLVLFVGALFDGPSAAERWALIKALSQFGTFKGLGTLTSNQSLHGQPAVTVPTFNLLHAHYRSPYVAFDRREVEDSYGHPLQKLSPADSKLVARFKFIPVLIVGNYYLSRPMVTTQEFEDASKRAFSFDQVHAALARNYAGYNLLGQLVSDINSETNILVAIICHNDGGRPANVCNGKTIVGLQRHIK
jgi:Domain of unknown function (DUF929)